MLLWFVLVTLISVSLCEDQVLFNGDAVLVVSDYDRFNNTAFNMTLRDFIIDFYNAFGIAPILQDTSYIPCSVSTKIASISVVYLGEFSNNTYPVSLLPNTDTKYCIDGKESHCVVLVYDDIYDVFSLIAMGNDSLGAIYAAYSVSELIFNVDPLHRFSGINGEYHPNGIILNASTKYIFGSALFEYRGLFNNDEDLLGNLFPDPYGSAVHSGTVLNWLFESILRMKGNMMIVGTVPFPDEISIALAAKRGIIVTHHHFNLMGSNTFRFPSSIHNEWLWQTTPSVPSFVWKSSMNALHSNTNGNVVFSVGYRGLNDYPAPCNNCTQQQNGMIISQVIANQSDWINKAFGSESKKITYLWQEGLQYFTDGYLVVPHDVAIILTDNGNGIIKDTLQYANVSQGIYTHTAMYNGNANQLTEMVSPFRHFEEIGKFSMKSKKNKYGIINTSDLKPCLLSTMAVFCYLYHGKQCENGDPKQFMIKWCQKRYLFVSEYRHDVILEIEQLYERYYNISYIQNGISDNYISNAIYSICEQYLKNIKQNNGKIDANIVADIKTKMQPNSTFLYIESLFTESLTLFNKISTSLIEESAHLYLSHILLQFAIHFYGASVVNDVYYSSLNLLNGNQKNALDYLERAINEDIQQIFKYFRLSEVGVWRGLYYGSHLSDFQRARSMLRSLYQWMDTNKCSLPTQPNIYYGFTWYQLPYSNNYPLFHYDSNVNMDTFCRIFCLNTGNEINNLNVTNCCMNNAEGAIFWMNDKCVNGATVEINVLNWNKCKYIKYTKDGSIPNQDTKTFVVNNQFMINITETTMLRARCQYYDGSMDQQITDSYFKLAEP